jgi:hypothetical protein
MPPGYSASRGLRLYVERNTIQSFSSLAFLRSSFFQSTVRNRKSKLFDHLVRPVQDRLRNRQADLFCGFQINDELEFRWSLHW